MKITIVFAAISLFSVAIRQDSAQSFETRTISSRVRQSVSGVLTDDGVIVDELNQSFDETDSNSSSVEVTSTLSWRLESPSGRSVTGTSYAGARLSRYFIPSVLPDIPFNIALINSPGPGMSHSADYNAPYPIVSDIGYEVVMVSEVWVTFQVGDHDLPDYWDPDMLISPGTDYPGNYAFNQAETLASWSLSRNGTELYSGEGSHISYQVRLDEIETGEYTFYEKLKSRYFLVEGQPTQNVFSEGTHYSATFGAYQLDVQRLVPEPSSILLFATSILLFQSRICANQRTVLLHN